MAYKVIGKAHVRVKEDGTVERFEIGDSIEPTEAELKAFGDKFVKVGEAPNAAPNKLDDSAPKLSSEAASKAEADSAPGRGARRHSTE